MHLFEKFSCYKYSLFGLLRFYINQYHTVILKECYGLCWTSFKLHLFIHFSIWLEQDRGASLRASMPTQLPSSWQTPKYQRDGSEQQTCAAVVDQSLTCSCPAFVIINKPQWRQAAFSYTDTHHVGLLPLVWPPCRSWMISSLMVIPSYLHVHIYKFMNLCVMFCFTSSQSSPILFWLLCCFMYTGWIL